MFAFSSSAQAEHGPRPARAPVPEGAKSTPKDARTLTAFASRRLGDRDRHQVQERPMRDPLLTEWTASRWTTVLGNEAASPVRP